MTCRLGLPSGLCGGQGVSLQPQSAPARPQRLYRCPRGGLGISPEQWVFALAALAAVPSPLQRWPAISVDASVPEDAPARRGQLAFIANCLPCHRLGGAGEATVGPDLLRPMPATAYFTEAGLRALIRNPAAVRHWPAQQMPAFDDNALSEFDIDAVIAYLHHLAARSK